MEKWGKEWFKKAPVVYSRTVFAIRFHFLVLQSKISNQIQGRWWYSINVLQGSTFNVHNEKSVKLFKTCSITKAAFTASTNSILFSSNSKIRSCCFAVYTHGTGHDCSHMIQPIIPIGIQYVIYIAIWHTVHLHSFPLNLVFRYCYTRNNWDLVWNHLW